MIKLNEVKAFKSKSQTCLSVLFDNCLQDVLPFIKNPRSFTRFNQFKMKRKSVNKRKQIGIKNIYQELRHYYKSKRNIKNSCNIILNHLFSID